MKRSHHKTLELIFSRPVPSSVRWADIESLLVALGAEVEKREGSRVAIIWNDQVKVFHRPHPSPNTDKGAVVSVKRWLEEHKVMP